MSFRRDSVGADHWRRWRQHHASTLIEIGLPHFLFEDERRWVHFVQEGGWDHQTGWNVKMLELSQLVALQDLLRNESEYEVQVCQAIVEGLIRKATTQ